MTLPGEAPSAWLPMVQNQLFLSIGVRGHALHRNAMDGHASP